jgi:uncharacterized protein YceK
MGKKDRTVTLTWASVVILILLSGCSSIRQQIVAAARQPGDTVLTTPEKVAQESICVSRQQPYVNVESIEVLPEMVKPGGRVNHRMIYVMCPLRKYSDTLKGRVIRNVFFKGEPVARNVRDAIELKAGRWAVDSFFTLPSESPLGVYALEVSLEMPGGAAQKQIRSFVVSNEFYLGGQ